MMMGCLRGPVAPLLIASAAILSGCATTIAHAPPPEAVYEAALPLGTPGLRIWSDEFPEGAIPQLAESARAFAARHADAAASGEPVQIDYLALSGGGSDGAFGAGVISGWTQSGERPRFEIVTGVSTGALLAPFAFLGPEWDEEMVRLYTSISTDDVIEFTFFDALRGGPAIGSSRRLRSLIEATVDQEMLAELAAEHRKGRRLYVGTTAIDSARPATWDMGKIAEIGGEEGRNLFIDVLLASAAIPGVFPPIPVEVQVDGRTFTELHADGGATAQVFAYPVPLNIRAFDALLPFETRRRIYVIRNAKARPEYFDNEPDVIELTRRAISILINAGGQGDLFRIAANARRDGIEFNLVYVPQDWRRKQAELFDNAYMRELVAVGRAVGGDPESWLDRPAVERYDPDALDDFDLVKALEDVPTAQPRPEDRDFSLVDR